MHDLPKNEHITGRITANKSLNCPGSAGSRPHAPILLAGDFVLKPSTATALLAMALLTAAPRSRAQDGASSRWAELAGYQYTVTPDVVYGVQNNYPLKMDVWRNRKASGPVPTLMYIHGGGWIYGDRTGAFIELFPYFQRGWNIVNVEYRMAPVSLAPAAVEDCRCALKWVIRNARQYGLDITRIVLTGHSAGGHLSLTTGMLTPDAGLDVACPGDEVLKVAAVINWFGISDVNDVIQGPNKKNYAEEWLGNLPNKSEIAKRTSPLTYVAKDNPPTISIHGDLDNVVPYQHSVRLHEALTRAGVPNQLVTIKGGGHGNFTDEETLRAYDQIWAFLDVHLPKAPAPAAPPH
jgi:acetyl esterase/lipase